MKLNVTDFPRKAQFPLMIALGTLPVYVLIVLHSAPDCLPALAQLVPAWLLLSLLCIVLPGRVRLPAGLLSCAALTLLGLYTLPIAQGISPVDRSTVHISQSVFVFFVPLFLSGLLLYGLQFAAWPREKEIPFNWYAFGVGAHLLAQIVGSVERRQGSETWTNVSPLLTAAFAAFLLLVLLSMNRITMHSASLGRQHIPSSMRRRNTAIVLGLLLAALVIAGIPAIVQFIERIWWLVIGAIGAIMAFIARLLESKDLPSAGGAGGGMEMMPYVEYQEPSLLALILEKLAMVLALAAFILLVFFVLRAVWRNALRILRLIQAHLARYAAVASQDYVDEITDTREEGGERTGSLLTRLRSRFARVDERRLTPAQRIRHRYRLLLRRHPDWPQSHTARETLPPETAALYEAARYSGREVSVQEAEQFADFTKKA